MNGLFLLLAFAVPNVYGLFGMDEVPSGLEKGSITLLSNDSSVYNYYKVDFFEKNAWVDKEAYKEKYKQILKDKHRTFQQIKLSKRLPFYGHLIDTVIVTSGGFIHVDEYKHSMLTHSMYIAPFMADLHTSDTYDPPAKIFFHQDETIMIIWWENIRLHYNKDVVLTFQLVYHTNGSIIFNYLNKLTDDTIKKLEESLDHSLKVGISDASYFIRQFSLSFQVQFMVPYHTMEVPLQELKNHSRVVFTPLPTCIEQDSCYKCAVAKVAHKLNCAWCPVASLCSDGVDRFIQKWMESGCDDAAYQLTTTKECAKAPKNRPVLKPGPEQPNPKAPSSNVHTYFVRPQGSTLSPVLWVSGMHKAMLLRLFVFALFFAIAVLCVWIIKSFKNPNTLIGRWAVRSNFLNQWRSRRSVTGASEDGPRGFGGALGMLHFNSLPSYVSFQNNEDDTFENVEIHPNELPQQRTSPGSLQLNTGLNERVYRTPTPNPVFASSPQNFSPVPSTAPLPLDSTNPMVTFSATNPSPTTDSPASSYEIPLL